MQGSCIPAECAQEKMAPEQLVAIAGAKKEDP